MSNKFLATPTKEKMNERCCNSALFCSKARGNLVVSKECDTFKDEFTIFL